MQASSMDSLTFKPTCSSFSFESITTRTNFLLFKVSRFNKFKSSTISFSCKSSLGSIKPDPKRNNPTFRLDSFSIFVPILLTIKGFVSSHKRIWISRLQTYNADTEKFREFFDGNYAQSAAFGAALLSVTATAKVRISPFVATLAANPTFVSGFFAWLIAQSMKVFLNFFVERKWDFRLLFASGGMPSSHSSLCTALTTSVALCHGISDSLFPVCLGFSLIVMYDAIGVRRHAGMQAEVLNVIIEDLFQGHPISERKLKELLGHTLSQVVAGAILGMVVAWKCCQGCIAATL